MITTIAAIAEKNKFSDHSDHKATYGNHFPEIVAIAATTIAEIEKVLSQRVLSLRSLESGFHMIAAIAEHSAIAAIIWKPDFNVTFFV